MSAYAPNPSSSGETGYAALSAGLLARKGEAIPAVDAHAHEGIDIEQRPMRPINTSVAPAQIGEKAIETLYSTKPQIYKIAAKSTEEPSGQAANTNLEMGPSDPDAKTAAPKIWVTPNGAKKPQINLRRTNRKPATRNLRRATVTFKMPLRELIRLRVGARDMETSCQQVLLDALECYLDASDIEGVSEAAFSEEIALLRKARKNR